MPCATRRNEALSHRKLLMVRSRIKQTAIQTKANKPANRQTATTTTAAARTSNNKNNKQQQTNNKQTAIHTYAPKVEAYDVCVRREKRCANVLGPYGLWGPALGLVKSITNLQMKLAHLHSLPDRRQTTTSGQKGRRYLPRASQA